MRKPSFLALVAAALLSLQLHGWLHADHGLSQQTEVCVACQLSQHGGSLESAPASQVCARAPDLAPTLPAPSRPSARFAPRPQVRGPPLTLIS